ncbi:MAG TPA: Zn-dependent alcohol dehydrogenase [Chloroflexota bacterium]
MRIKAAVMYERKAPLQVEDLDLLAPRHGEVLVKVAAAGVCHSDLHAITGDVPSPYPCVLGHEGAGVVQEVGPGVTNVRPGDHVLLLWRATCGRCEYCTTGRPALCDVGSEIRWTGRLADGSARFRRGDREILHFAGVSSFASHTVLPSIAVLPIRRDVPLDRAALIGCGVMTGVGAALNTARVEPGTAVAVFGCGGIGLNVVQGARLAGANQIIAVDIFANKLDMARGLGATDAVNASEVDPVAAIKDLTGGAGVHYAFDAIGNPKVVRQAFDATRRGGTVVVVGIAPVQQDLAVNASTLVYQEKRLLGSLYGSSRFAVDMPRLLDLYMAGRLKLDELISRRYPIEGINDAFAALERGEVARSIIVYD